MLDPMRSTLLIVCLCVFGTSVLALRPGAQSSGAQRDPSPHQVRWVKRVRLLTVSGKFPIPPLPFYGRSRRFKREDGESDFEVRYVWSKFALAKFLARPAEEWPVVLDRRAELFSYYSAQRHEPAPEHQYVSI